MRGGRPRSSARSILVRRSISRFRSRPCAGRVDPPTRPTAAVRKKWCNPCGHHILQLYQPLKRNLALALVAESLNRLEDLAVPPAEVAVQG